MEHEQKDKFLQWVADNYEYLKQHHMAYCLNTKQKWNEDIFCDTYLKIAERILKDGIKDDSDKGFENYFFMAFKLNTKREAQYCRNRKKDDNADIAFVNEQYKNSLLTQEEKLLQDLKKDFSVLFILAAVEQNFPAEHFNLFRQKFLSNLTYKQLADRTGLKGVRQKVVDVKNWLKENVTKEMVDEAFNRKYGNFFRI